MKSESELLIGVILGLLMGIVGNIFVELMFRWWDSFVPNSNKHIGLQLIICTIFLIIIGGWLWRLALKLRSTEY